MRTQAELDSALAFWKQGRENAAKDLAQKPEYTEAYHAIQAIVWALEWMNGRDQQEIIEEAQKEAWVKAVMP